MFIASTSKQNSKTFFQYINKKKNTKSGIGPLKDPAGELITNDQRMASKLNEYFCSVFNSSEREQPDADRRERDQTNNVNIGNNFQTIEVTAEDVVLALNKLKVNKSPGPDNIFPRILKE